ncbi:hypothetical protein M0C40_05690 [Spiroplasma citri]|uniref:Plectrovirus-related protein n=1 Tax=Spiroplasma citri TaxID=2133 RepID=A0AAX3SWH8_SPICI|nr:hypothetical protein [Spiroplasma citri]WFG95588.1 hypothetical protein M0C40_05690 [Spiroplasma citri]
MKIIKQQKICDVINCYKLSSFITEEFETNKILWTCQNNKVLLNQIKYINKEKILLYNNLENSRIEVDWKTGYLKIFFSKINKSNITRWMTHLWHTSYVIWFINFNFIFLLLNLLIVFFSVPIFTILYF